MMTHYNTWEDYINKADGRLYRMYVYNKMINEKRFGKEELFDNREPRFIFIKESIILPDGDILLGIQEIERGEQIDDYLFKYTPIQYYKLSDIWLVHVPSDLYEIFEREIKVV